MTLKANESAMKEEVIHKPLINHMICTLNDDIECLCSESWQINYEGAGLNAHRCPIHGGENLNQIPIDIKSMVVRI